MQLLLKCKCTDGEVKLAVRDREQDEDIRDYMDYVQQKIGVWHAVRGCDAKSLEYMKMPVTDGKPIGET